MTEHPDDPPRYAPIHLSLDAADHVDGLDGEAEPEAELTDAEWA